MKYTVIEKTAQEIDPADYDYLYNLFSQEGAIKVQLEADEGKRLATRKAFRDGLAARGLTAIKIEGGTKSLSQEDRPMTISLKL